MSQGDLYYDPYYLDPLVGSERFDFVLDLGAELPMRAIGMLVGIADADQPTVRAQAQRALRNRPGEPLSVKKDHYFDGDMFASANHDERRFEDPERFDIHRPIRQHVTFGYGVHFVSDYVEPFGARRARLRRGGPDGSTVSR